MKTILVSLLFLVVLSSYAPVPEINSENGNRFAFSMMKVLMEEHKGKNLVYSPYGLRNCFAYAYPGAAKDTKKEIQAGLMFQESPEEELKSFQKSNNLLQTFTESKVKIANSMWIKADAAPIKPAYLALTKKYTDAVGVLKNAQQVNGWVSEKTSGEIKELVTDGELKNIKVLLLNTLTLDAKWKSPFSLGSTYSGDFISGAETLKVPTMTSEVVCNHYEDKNMQLVQLSYTDELRMSIIMPLKEEMPLDWNINMQKMLEGQYDRYGDYLQWQGWQQFVYLHLPKFKLATTLNMIPALKKLGVNQAFDEVSGDFSNMNELLYLSLVKQKAVIELTEYGTKASAATAIGAVERSIPPTIRIDRPFYFMIHSTKTGEILFMGHVVNPIKD